MSGLPPKPKKKNVYLKKLVMNSSSFINPELSFSPKLSSIIRLSSGLAFFYKNVAFYDKNFYNEIEIDVKSIPIFSIFKEKKVSKDWPLSYRTPIEGKLINISTYSPKEKEIEIQKLYDYKIKEKFRIYMLPSINFLDLYTLNNKSRYSKSEFQINIKNLYFYEIIDIKNINSNISINNRYDKKNQYICSITQDISSSNISYISINSKIHLLIPSNIQGKTYLCYGTIYNIMDFFILVIGEFELYRIIDIYMNQDERILNTIYLENEKNLNNNIV